MKPRIIDPRSGKVLTPGHVKGKRRRDPRYRVAAKYVRSVR